MDINDENSTGLEEDPFGQDGGEFNPDDIIDGAEDETPEVLTGSGSQDDDDEDDAFGDDGAMSDDLDDGEYAGDGEEEYAGDFDQEDIDETMESNGEEVMSDEEVEDFVPIEKESYDEASAKKPGKLNKKIILNTIVALAAVLFFGTLFMPESCKTRSNKDAKKNGEAKDVTLSDFKSMSTGRKDGSGRDARPKGKKAPVLGPDGHWYDENGNIVDDEVNAGVYDEVFREEGTTQETIVAANEQKQPEVVATGGTYAAEERPDTRGDAIQVGIMGIKGLSGTRQNYMTDYEETKAANQIAAYDGLQKYDLPDLNSMQNALLASVNQSNGMTSYKLQNDQAGKQSFHTEGRENAGTGEWRPLNSLWEGSIFEAELTTALNTDIPGEITARVTRNIYSSQTGEYLLIPQNSILYGTYNSSISYSQSRVQIAWNKIIRPDGYVINLGNFNAVDKHGAAGVKGFVNDHPLAYLKAIAVMSVFNIVNKEFEASISDSKNEYAQNVMANSQEIANTLGEKLIDRAMDVQPTITKPVGTIVYVLTNQSLTLPPVEIPPVVQPYQRKWGWQN